MKELEQNTKTELELCSDVRNVVELDMPISWYYLINKTALNAHSCCCSDTYAKLIKRFGGIGNVRSDEYFAAMAKLILISAQTTYDVGRNWPGFGIVAEMSNDTLCHRLVDEVQEFIDDADKHGVADFNTLAELADVMYFTMYLVKDINLYSAIFKGCNNDRLRTLVTITRLLAAMYQVSTSTAVVDFAIIAAHKWYLRDGGSYASTPGTRGVIDPRFDTLVNTIVNDVTSKVREVVNNE